MEVLKLIVFWMGALLFIFGGYFSCRVFRPTAYIIFGIMLCSLAGLEHLSITFFGHQNYKMATRGFEITLADICALVLFLHILTNLPRKEMVKWPPLMIPQICFIVLAVLSWALSKGSVSNPLTGAISSVSSPFMEFTLEPIFYLGLYPWFEISKLLRGMFIFWVCVNLANDRNMIRVMYGVFAALIIYFTIKALFMRYGLHVNRVSAGIGQYNNFNTFMGLMGAFILPLAFTSRRFITSAFFWGLILAVIVTIILTISRSALAAFGIVLVVGSPILLLKFFNGKNLMFVLFGMVATLGLLVKAQQTLVERFVYENPTDKSLLVREALNDEAKMMARDFPLGIGMGNFSAWSILRYAQITGAGLGNFAHNSFYLTLAETGYLGLIVFLIFWLRYAQLGFIALIHRITGNDSFALGAVMSADLAILFLIPQLWFQFTYRATAIYLMVHIILGVGVRQYLLAVQESATSLRNPAKNDRRRAMT